MKRFFFLVFASLTMACSAQDCRQLPTTFTSYATAVKRIKSSTFELQQRCNTSSSSWIIDAAYYSCDSKVGYLLISTSKTTYIHAKVPVEQWNAFKNASSLGRFYSAYIKNNYPLRLR